MNTNNPCRLYKNQESNNNLLQILNQIEETINKRRLIESQSNIILSISGGQDSIFLLFCLSFLQRQIGFNLKPLWCNHFWQKDSFYTTLHLTKSAHAFSLPIIGFIPLHVNSPFSFFQLGFLRKKDCSISKKLNFSRKKHCPNKFQISKRFRSTRFFYKSLNHLLVIRTILLRWPEWRDPFCPDLLGGLQSSALHPPTYKAPLCTQERFCSSKMYPPKGGGLAYAFVTKYGRCLFVPLFATPCLTSYTISPFCVQSIALSVEARGIGFA